MGLPRSFYPLLYNLRREEEYTAEAKEAVKPFSLFAFVIGHPEETDGVREEVAGNFAHLHQATGERLLFFIPIDEPEGWRESMAGSVGDDMLELYNTIPDSLKSRDPRRTELVFSTALGVQTGELPALIVSEDLQKPEYYVLRTSRTKVRGQLTALGNLAQDLYRQGGGLSLDQLSAPGIDSCSGLHGCDFIEPLASLLHDALSITLSSNSKGNDLSTPMARDSIVGRCQDLRVKLEEISPVRAVGQSPQEPMPEVLETLETLARLLSGLVVEDGGPDAEWPLETEEFPESCIRDWDPESRLWWETGNQVCQFIHSRSRDAQEPEFSHWDWSSVVVCWGKAFENELNLSAAHWIRKDLGVDLPPFFNLHQPGVEAKFKPSEDYILDFNRRCNLNGTNDLWKPLEIGPLQGVINHYAKPEGLDWLPADQRASFNDCMDRIREIRNSACHPYAVGMDEAAEMLDSIWRLNDLGIIPGLSALKYSLKGLGQEPVGRSSLGASIWISRGGQRYGPYTEELVRRYLADGGLHQDDHAWRSGMPGWAPLQSLL